MAKWGIKVKVKQSGNFFNKVLEKVSHNISQNIWMKVIEEKIHGATCISDGNCF